MLLIHLPRINRPLDTLVHPFLPAPVWPLSHLPRPAHCQQPPAESQRRARSGPEPHGQLSPRPPMSLCPGSAEGGRPYGLLVSACSSPPGSGKGGAAHLLPSNFCPSLWSLRPSVSRSACRQVRPLSCGDRVEQSQCRLQPPSLKCFHSGSQRCCLRPTPQPTQPGPFANLLGGSLELPTGVRQGSHMTPCEVGTLGLTTFQTGKLRHKELSHGINQYFLSLERGSGSRPAVRG